MSIPARFPPIDGVTCPAGCGVPINVGDLIERCPIIDQWVHAECRAKSKDLVGGVYSLAELQYIVSQLRSGGEFTVMVTRYDGGAPS